MTNLPTGLLTVDSSYCFSLSFSFSLSRSIKYVSLTLNYSELKKETLDYSKTTIAIN